MRRLLAITLVALLTVAVGEVFVRARDSALPTHQVWFGPEMQFKDRQIGRLAKRGGADIVFIGSSSMDAAADPARMPRLAEAGTVYNAGTGAGTMPIIDTWARGEVLRRLHPNVVVIGITPRELNPNDLNGRQLTRNFYAAPAVKHLIGTESALEKAERHLESWSALFRFRTDLRQPRYLGALVGIGNPPGPDYYSKLVAPTGQFIGFRNAPYNYSPAVRATFRNNAFHDYTVGTDQVARLRRLIEAAKQSGATPVLVSLPVSPDLERLMPNGAADSAAAEAAMKGTADAEGVPFLEAGVWERKYFADPGHVNAAGSARFSAYVDREVSGLRTGSR